MGAEELTLDSRKESLKTGTMTNQDIGGQIPSHNKNMGIFYNRKCEHTHVVMKRQGVWGVIIFSFIAALFSFGLGFLILLVIFFLPKRPWCVDCRKFV